MSENGKRRPLADRLSCSLKEGIDFAAGDLNLRTTEMPQRPPTVGAEEVVRLREHLGMSRTVFARMLNVSAKTLQSWEQGTRQPSQAALRLLQILKMEPKLVLRAVGIRLTTPAELAASKHSSKSNASVSSRGM